jgi:hypothetical protein
VRAVCIRKGRPGIHDYHGDLADRQGMPPGHAPVVREIVLPIIINDRIVAILDLGNKQSEYVPNDIDLVPILANLAWDIILKNVRRSPCVKARKISATSLLCSTQCATMYQI